MKKREFIIFWLLLFAITLIGVSYAYSSSNNSIKVISNSNTQNKFELTYFHGLTVDDLYKKDSFARQKVQEIKDAGFTLIPLSSKCYYPGNPDCPDYNQPIPTVENCQTTAQFDSGCVIDYYTHESLELLAEYGIKVILMNFRTINAYVDGYTETSLKSLVDTYGGYKNIVGWDIDDEPYMSEFENRIKIVNYLNKIDPGRPAYINLSSNYLDSYYNSEGLDTNTLGRKVRYQNEYLWYFVDKSNISYISIDHYPNFLYTPINSQIKSPKNLYYSNLLDVLSIYKIRKLKGDHLIPMNIVESTNHKIGIYNIEADKNDIIYQVSTNLAFGMKRISYFTYADFQGNNQAMLDKNKKITNKYNIIKGINKWAYNLGNELYDKEIKNIYGLNENFVYEDGFATANSSSSKFLDKYLCDSKGNCANTYRNSELETNLSTYMSEYNNSNYINTIGKINVYKADTKNNSTGIVTFFDDDSFMFVNTNMDNITQFEFYHGALSPLTSFEYFNSYQNKWLPITSNITNIEGFRIIPDLNSVYIEPGYNILLRKVEKDLITSNINYVDYENNSVTVFYNDITRIMNTISVKDGYSVKLYDGSTNKTSGPLTSNCILKVFKNNSVVEEYKINGIIATTYEITPNYIYTLKSQFETKNITAKGVTYNYNNNHLEIKYNGKVKKIPIVTLNTSYKLENYVLYTNSPSFDKTKVSILNGKFTQSGDTLNIYNSNDLLIAIYKISNTVLENLELDKIYINKDNIVISKNVYEYKYVVKNDIQEVEIKVIPKDTNCSVEIENKKLKVGENNIKITVKSKTGQTKEYKIIIFRLEKEEVLSTNTNVLAIKIKNYSLDFKNNINQYNLKIGREKSLEIDVLLEDKYATYEILNNNNLVNGSVITIKVTSADKKDIKEYKITITKDISDDVPSDDDNDINDIPSDDDNDINDIPSDDNIKAYVCFGVGLLSVAFVIVFAISRKKTNINKDYE